MTTRGPVGSVVRGSPVRRAWVGFVAVVVAAALSTAGAPAAVSAMVPGSVRAAAVLPSPADAELEFLQLLNGTRSERGLAPLKHDSLIVPIAREWSGAMAGSDTLSHRPDLRAQFESRVTRDWQRIGENVGRGGGVRSLHDAFVASPAHFANIVGDYNRIGVGVVISGSTIWVTFNFLKGPDIQETASARVAYDDVATRGIEQACPSETTPAPAFTDLAGSVHAPSIGCVTWWGAASGLSSDRFGPTGSVTRAQLASFVAKTIEAAGKPLPDSPADAFADDEDSVHELRINQLAALGVVTGKGATTFAPGEVVSRAAMATFLVRAHDVVAATALPAGTDSFGDDNGTTHEASIDKVAGAGLAGGTGAGAFAPAAAVQRGAMATFLSRTVDLLVAGGDTPAR